MKSAHKRELPYIIFLIVVIVHIFLLCQIGLKREYMFTDEVYSYGLANSENYSFLDPDNNPTLLNWTKNSFFSNYIKYDETAPFSFRAAFVNQANDVHPPLYYCLLHIVCYFFKDYVYSPIPGLFLNLLMIPLIDGLLFYISRCIFSNSYLALSAVVLWSFSAAGLSNAVFIRMYLLMTLFVLLLIAYHYFVLKHESFLQLLTKHKQPKSFIRYLILYVSLCAIITLGGLTHYYFYFFAATLGLCVCVYLLILKKYRLLVAYGSALWLGVGVAFAIFPSAIHHIFGYRGSYATGHLGSFTFSKFYENFKFINDSLLGGCFLPLIIAVILFISGRYFASRIDRYSVTAGTLSISFTPTKKAPLLLVITPKKWLFLFILIATVGFLYVAIQGSEIISSRYIYPAYPILSIAVISLCCKLWGNYKNSSLTFFVFAGIIASLSVNLYGIDWQYKDYHGLQSAVEDLKGKDCIIVCKDEYWVNVLQGINLYLNMDEVRCVYESDLPNIEQILTERSSDDALCIAFFSDNGYSSEDQARILTGIINYTSYSNFELTYDYQTTVYSLA